MDEEAVAHILVADRNQLKADFRRNDPPKMVALMEARNMAKYGNPLGPGPDWFFERYGSWRLVIDAASRPADLNDGL